MPPKGWRKNAEGQYPQPSRASLVSIDDILFPRSTIQKLAKSIVDESGSAMISKDSLIAIQRSATVFVSHILYHARQHSKNSGRKTVNAQDIFGALEDAEFSGFLPELRVKLGNYEEVVQKKRSKKPSASKGTSAEGITKKTKGANGSVIVKAEDDEEEDDDDDDEEVENDGDHELIHDDDDDDDDGIEEQEHEDANPIAATSRAEAELADEDDGEGEIVDVATDSEEEV